VRGPVIVIGAHRSGTSAVINALRTMGLFTGHAAHIDENGESLFFLTWHEYYMNQLGASWHHPEPFIAALQTAEGFSRCQTAARRHLDGRFCGKQSHLRRYAGWPIALSLLAGKHWGWKDPRNTLFLPVWLKIFPEARVIHVLRHPIDAALSLRARQLHRSHESIINAPQLSDIDNALQLVGLYVERGLSFRSLGLRYCELQYHQLQANPHQILEELADFCGLPKGRNYQGALRQAVAAIEREGHDRTYELSPHKREELWSWYPPALRFDYQ
jgi:hypothetical protein